MARFWSVAGLNGAEAVMVMMTAVAGWDNLFQNADDIRSKMKA